MTEITRVVLSWSSGKDSAWALQELRCRPGVKVVGLLTVVDSARSRVPMHKTPRELVRLQAKLLNLPLCEVELDSEKGQSDYDKKMRAMLAQFRSEAVTHVAFGDLFLDELRDAREAKMAGTGLKPLFPLWKRDTRVLAQQMVEAGLRARISEVDTAILPTSFVGRVFDSSFLADLPAGVDPCGELGEFHSFAFAGPMFPSPIAAEAFDGCW